MGWAESIGTAIGYIENHMTEELTIESIANQAFLSPFYFQKGFAMLCGYTVSEYIRQRRLALAAGEVVSTDEKIIDIAIKYGYDSPDSFTKAFTRFHGTTPTAVRKGGARVKSFAPLKINFTLEGGYIMDYKVVEKDAFTIMGAARMFKYDTAFKEIPEYWEEHFRAGKGELINGIYGVCIDKNSDTDEFEYVIADDYAPWKDVPEGMATRVIPKHTWAVFAYVGALPKSLQDVNQKIFSEWIPSNPDYEIAAGYNIELYSNPMDFEKGTQDEKYHGEIWIPVKKK